MFAEKKHENKRCVSIAAVLFTIQILLFALDKSWNSNIYNGFSLHQVDRRAALFHTDTCPGINRSLIRGMQMSLSIACLRPARIMNKPLKYRYIFGTSTLANHFSVGDTDAERHVHRLQPHTQVRLHQCDECDRGGDAAQQLYVRVVTRV